MKNENLKNSLEKKLIDICEAISQKYEGEEKAYLEMIKEIFSKLELSYQIIENHYDKECDNNYSYSFLIKSQYKDENFLFMLDFRYFDKQFVKINYDVHTESSWKVFLNSPKSNVQALALNKLFLFDY